MRREKKRVWGGRGGEEMADEMRHGKIGGVDAGLPLFISEVSLAYW